MKVLAIVSISPTRSSEEMRYLHESFRPHFLAKRPPITALCANLGLV